MSDVLRFLGVIAAKHLDVVDFPSEYCLLELFSAPDTTDAVAECAQLFADYVKEHLPRFSPRAEKLMELFHKNQAECRRVYPSLSSSCFQADLNSSNILVDDDCKFVGLFDLNLCGKDKNLNYTIRDALWATYQSCLVDKDNNYIFYFDKSLLELIDVALKVLKDNFDDGIYNHTVGCAILCKDVKIFKGVNCDGIHGSCAEYITMGIAVSAGERDFDTIVAVHEKHLNCVIPPCGNCRQMLFEYCPDVKVIVNDENGKLIKVKACDLLPFAWKPVIC